MKIRHADIFCYFYFFFGGILKIVFLVRIPSGQFSMRVIYYSISAQNGYGPSRPYKIALLTLVVPRGVTDLFYLS